MKRIKKIVTSIILTLMLIVTSALMQAQPVIAHAATTVKLSTTNLTLMQGKSYTLKITGATGKVTWSSSKNTVATVSSKGTVKAVKNGTAYIIAAVAGKTYKCAVSVLPAFNMNEDKMAAEIAGRDLTWYGQTFTVVKGDISNVDIVDISTSDDQLTKTVTATMTIDRTVIKFDTTAIITYTGNTSKWSVSNVNINSTVNELNISGSYIGNVFLNAGMHYTTVVSRYMDLYVENMKSDGIFTGTITLSANADSPTAETNVYAIKGGVNALSGVITIVIVSHISGNEGWETFCNGNADEGFYVDIVYRGISGKGGDFSNDNFAYLLTVTKENPNTIPIK